MCWKKRFAVSSSMMLCGTMPCFGTELGQGWKLWGRDLASGGGLFYLAWAGDEDDRNVRGAGDDGDCGQLLIKISV